MQLIRRGELQERKVCLALGQSDLGFELLQ